MCYPTVREHSSHDRDEATVNDHQQDLDAHNDPCAFRINTDCILRRIAFPWSAILDCSEIRSMTSYVWFNLVLNKSLFTHSRDIHPRDLVTRCTALWMASHRVGPEYLSITWSDKPRSCNNTPQHISTEYPRYTFMASIFQSGGGL